MSDFSRRQVGGEIAALQGDVERAIARLRADMKAEELPYTPATATDWAGDPPETVGQALDRIALHIRSGAGAVAVVELT